ncbi:MAG: phage holin family protein [Bacteroidales bacterium]|nr:phage holin family protein [Bacteroidales bacterium]MEE0907533.1 phage holin family protein [Muribaculaceae bacterium]
MAENKYEELWAELKKYLTLQIDYAKLTTVEKLVVLLSAIAMVAVMLILGACVLFYLSFAVVFMLSDAIGSTWGAYLIVSGIFLVLMLVVYALRQKLILDPVSRFLTRLFLHHK